MTALLEIGDRLRAARLARGVSQHDLGEAIGVRQQQIARWEAASYRTASLSRVAAVAEALGFEPGDPCVVAETLTRYRTSAPPADRISSQPVRDLGQVITRLRQHGDFLNQQYGVKRIAVFGSFATGTQAPGSDVDLLVDLGDRDKAHGFRFVELGRALEELLCRKVDVAQPHLIHGRLRPRVEKEAVDVWRA